MCTQALLCLLGEDVVLLFQEPLSELIISNYIALKEDMLFVAKLSVNRSNSFYGGSELRTELEIYFATP